MLGSPPHCACTRQDHWPASTEIAVDIWCSPPAASRTSLSAMFPVSTHTMPRQMASPRSTIAAPFSAQGFHTTRRTTTANPAGDKRSSPSLGDQVLALANGKTQQEITAACKGVRPNHVGVVIARHKRAGRIEERDGKLYATQSTRTVLRAAL